MKQRKSVIALLLVAIIGIVGLTLAYFSNSDTIENQFKTKEYGSTYTEEFVSPDNWLPGDTTNKTVVATNTGEVDQAVRIKVSESWTTHNNGTLNGWIHPDGTKSTHTTETELSTDEKVAILNLANTSDWTKVTENGTDYYYYNYKLAPSESTTSFLESVTFNSKTKLDDTCVTTVDGSTRTTTCNSSGNDYDNATYKLTFTIETVQYNKYNEAWGTSATIAAEKQVSETFAQHIINNANAASITNYTDGVTSEAYTFNHEATEQTGALTDYRYIGNTPNNYVYFNCTDESDTSTCETWRIIGVFNVDDGTGNFENRVKLVRGSSLNDRMSWNDIWENDWNNSSLNSYLNNDYLLEFTIGYRNMIDNTKYYLGSLSEDNFSQNIENDYAFERGNAKVSVDRELNWTGKIGLPYPSDYGFTYAKGIDNVCYNNLNYCSESAGGNSLSGWMYSGNDKSEYTFTWTITPIIVEPHTFYSLFIYQGGNLSYGGISVVDVGWIRPTLYLKSNTYIVDGDGSSTTPYQIELR